MRRWTLTLTTLALAAAGIGAGTRPLEAQNPFDVIKRKAEEARKKAEEIKRKADSTRLATERARAAADSARAAVEGAAKALSTSGGDVSTRGTTPATSGAPASSGRAASQGATPEPRGTTPPSGRGGRPAPSPEPPPAGGPQRLSTTAAKVDAQVLLAGEPGLQFEISPRGQHLAAVVLRGSRMAVVYDGVDGPRFDEIINAPGGGGGRVAFSEDGSRWAYVGRVGQEWVVMVDGKELARGRPWNQSTGAPTVTALGFTPGGARHVYFRTDAPDSQKPEYRLYIDGAAGPASELQMLPLFSPNGERHAYVAGVRDRAGNSSQILVIDGRPSPYPGGDPQFTADGQHVFTRAPVAGANAIDVFLDGKPFLRAASAQLYPAPVGSGVLGVVWTDFQAGRRISFLTIGNRRVPGSDCRGNGGIDRVFFAPDARHWAVRCQDSPGSFWVMADGKKGRDYQGITTDVAFTADGRAVYQATMNGRTFVVSGDQESDGYASVEILRRETSCVRALAVCERGADRTVDAWPAVITGNTVAFIAKAAGATGHESLVVINGKAAPAIGAQELTFSSDGAHYAYRVGASRFQVVVDGARPLGPPALPTNVAASNRPTIVFSRDGAHVAYASFPESNDQARGVALDGRFAPTPSSTWNDNLTFTPDGKHLIWVARLPGVPRWVVHVDGEPVQEIDATLGIQNQPDAWWSMAAGGVLTFIAQDGGAMKRFRITPGSGSLETLLTRATDSR